ncbi:hypothetical protein DPMN_069280 [Dreissena polymorpha]|uniref:Zinc finger PHD-type domain-containing protein n=1 Tax=Dreissena polymorpha TaxID=45954 RepID=A0A9D3YYT3_DREPO|nr:hypothetical protein DPMN_069280 [Dreissena polymorpha]
MRAGRDVVEQYLQKKLASKQQAGCTCTSNNAPRAKKRPSAGGRELTSPSFIAELDRYEENKENGISVQPQLNQNSTINTINAIASPIPSTSCIQIDRRNTHTDTETDDDSEMDDSDTCCVCNKTSPLNLDKRPYQCDQCGHWVHLQFCHETVVLRRGDVYMCRHCS